MKKKIIIITIIVLVILCGLFIIARNSHKISMSKVSKIIIWEHTPENAIELTNDEITDFVCFFNDSSYCGKADGSGGTPEYGATVYFYDGSFMSVNDFIGANKFEVSLHKENEMKRWYYVESEELTEFVSVFVEDLKS